MAPSTAAAEQAQVTLTPNSGWSDSLLEIQGANFSPNTQVRITVESLSYWATTATTNNKGAFDCWFNVPDGLNAGTYAIKAEDSNGNKASTPFTLYGVFVTPGVWGQGVCGIKTQKQMVQWTYDNYSIICDTWKFYHDSQNSWYNVMSGSYGLYVLRLTYNGTTYVFDLANGKYNAWPQALKEKVSGFTVKSPSQIQGTIQIYNPSGSVLLATITLDIYAPTAPLNHYAVVFKITSETNLSDVALYALYDMNVYQSLNNWAAYDQKLDAVYQYYGPGSGSSIPEQQKGYAGYASILPASSYHDVDIDCQKLLSLATYFRDFSYNLRDRSQVYGDAYVNCAVGMQWSIGSAAARTDHVVPIAFAASDQSLENFETNLVKAKMLGYQAQPGSPIIVQNKNEGPGSSLINAAGWGFMPYSNVELTFGGFPVGLYIADYSGCFDGNFIVPTSVNGTYPIMATDNYGLEASANFKVVDLTWEYMSDKLDQYNAQLLGLINDKNGTLSALIRTDNGNVIASLNQVSASLSGLIRGSNDATLARIDTSLGTITTKVNEISARVTEIIGNAKGDILARIDSKVGQILVEVDQINATLVGIIGDAKGDVLARIDTTVGQTLAKVDQINATFVGIIGSATGDILARIDSRVGETLVKVDQINATLVGIIGDARGDVLARIDSKVGETLVKADAINVTLAEIIGNAKGDVLARIDSRVGETLVKVDQINATLTDIIGNAKGDILARIDTNVGTALVKLDTIAGQLASVSGNVATIQTSIGNIQVSLSDINATVTKIENTTATVQTSLGALTGKVVAIEGDIVTIQTDLGTLKTDTKLVRSDFSLQPIVIAAVIEVAAISGIVYTIWAYRKWEVSRKEIVVPVKHRVRRQNNKGT